MTGPHLGAEAMTAPNDVAALVERGSDKLSRKELAILKLIVDDHYGSEIESGGQGIGMAKTLLGKIGRALSDANALEAAEAKIVALTSENATAWQMFASEAEKLADEMELNLSLEAKVIAQAATIAALQAEVERAKEDEGHRLLVSSDKIEDQVIRYAVRLWLISQGAARSASRKENTP